MTTTVTISGSDCAEPKIRLRRAKATDAETVFEWRNLPEISMLGSQRRTVDWDEHRIWFANAVTAENRCVFIVEINDVSCGLVRFDNDDNREAEVSIYLIPGNEGKGYGAESLVMACEAVTSDGWAVQICAKILRENRRSISAFRKAGFQHAPDRSENIKHIVMLWVPESKIPHNRLTFGLREEDAVADAVRTGEWAGGPILGRMEASFARIANMSHAIATSSGISALRLGLLALDIGPGDKIAVPAYSCVAIANAVLSVGGIPVPVDVECGTWNLSPKALREACGAHDFRAIIVVHTFGMPADIEALRKTGVPIIEDCSHGIGRGEMGSGGDVAMLSLYATKLVGAGQGGIVLTSDESIACRIRDAADYVDKPKSAHRWRETMSSPEAALALCQLDRLSANLNRRDQIAARYSEEFSEVRKPLSHPYRVWYRYTICCDTAASLIAKLGVRNVCAAVPIDNWLTEDESASLPIASRAYRQLVSLPIFPSLKKHEQERVIAAVQDALD